MQPSGRPPVVPIPPNVLESVRSADNLVAFTGAGMSAESGISTFRDGETGLWSRFRFDELATPEAWAKDPALVWAWYQWRAHEVRRAEPNPGHRALAALGAHRHVRVVTQNVDDLHERAGSSVAAHLHGSLFAPRCRDCGRPYSGAVEPPWDSSTPEPTLRVDPPICGHCLSEVRPGIVWFGEALPMDAWAAAEAAVLASDAVLVIGTSSLVYPAARLPESALNHGIPVIEINPEPTPLSPFASAIWRTTAATGLPALAAALGADVTR